MKKVGFKLLFLCRNCSKIVNFFQFPVMGYCSHHTQGIPSLQIHAHALEKERFGTFCTGTRCDSHFRNPAVFKILKKTLLLQRQTLHLQKALDLCYLEPKGQGSMTSLVSQTCHRRQGVKNPPRTCKKSTKNPFCAKWAWHPPDSATPFSSWLQIAKIPSFLLMYCMSLQQQWFLQKIKKSWRKYIFIIFVILRKCGINLISKVFPPAFFDILKEPLLVSKETLF